ncbi:zinc finger C2HC domain-containing protein 1A [Protopterus annectens]|uniref:zinc finger C2HC domain-containing protein 1A n=1 Tax=Protopterus annectens TaxID=7888 RepID=UPI001CFB663F|nr:zinc finger C2HC domain-containing protein 1A [Protopterus annectens]
MEELDDFNDPKKAGDLLPCKNCGRTFFGETLKKHAAICQKVTTKRRKAFDSSRQRAEGTDISTVKPLKPRPEPPKKQSNWRRKHEDFIATIRAAKGLTQTLKEGGPLPPPPPPSYDPDYVQCPYCQRRFNENAADRHISFCKEQAARISNKPKAPADGKGKTVASRTQTKPPAAKKSSVPSPSSVSSRLPQPSSAGKPAGGVAVSKVTSSPTGPSGKKSQSLSPAHRSPGAITSPPSGADYKSEYDISDSSVSMNGENVTGNDRNSSGQMPKFCHECGTKHPVEWAKFCCECGVRRLIL